MLSKDMNNQENQKKQNGSRRYSVLLLALLFIGMATYGTYAYFTDSTSVNGNIKLSTGTVSLAQSEANWIYNIDGANTAIDQPEPESELAFTNVQPGDSFTKEVTVEYTGTLYGMVEVNKFTEEQIKEVSKGLDYNIDIDIETTHEDNMVVSGDKVTVTLTATLPIGNEESYSPGETNRNNQENKVIDLNALDKAVEISVVQLGASKEP